VDGPGEPAVVIDRAVVRTSGRDYSRANADGYHYDSNNYNYSSHSGYDVYEVQTNVDRYRSKYQEGEREQIGVEEKACGAHDALAIIAELKAVTARVRRDMATKYSIEF
jgi:hypothetical protein